MKLINKLKKKSSKLKRRFLRKINYKTHKPALNGLDDKLAPYLNFKNGFFIECGANDGYSQSNTYYLEKKCQWKGLLVEGIPELYEKCRTERPAARVVNYALVAPDYTEKSVTMHFANLMSLVSGSLKTEEKESGHLEKARLLQKQMSTTYTVEVPARTLESVLDEQPPVNGIDFFSLDVEGYELNVLHGLNLNKYRPRYILVEANFEGEIDAFLKEHNYILKDKLTHHDCLYIDKQHNN